MKPHCSVIALNWNGAEDTIEFIASLWNQVYDNFTLILLDNHSDDGSVAQIKQWAENPVQPSSKFDLKNFISFKKIPLIEIEGVKIKEFRLPENFSNKGIILVRNESNLGFARAVNRGIKLAKRLFDSDYYFLLNNDIFIDKFAIQNIIASAEKYQEYIAFQSAIFYYDYPDKIWNAGGLILPWGQTKYFKKLTRQPLRRTYSLSGCALLLRRRTINEIGLLDERFFHGEEDLDYSLRIVKNGKKAGVVQNSIIYHKVSVAANVIWTKRIDRFINLALNRLLNMKSYFSPFVWKIWRIGTLFYYFILLQKIYKISIKRSVRILAKIYKYSNFVEKVDQKILKQFQDELQ